MKGKPIPYSDEELGWLEEHRLLPLGEYAASFGDAFGRAVHPNSLNALRKRKGWSTGRTGRFEAGTVPHNKGKPFPSKGRSRDTQFKPGTLSGRAALVRKPIGFERLSKEGYLERKINDDLPFRKRWRAVHLIRWEALHGPLPLKHCLKCVDGNRLNTDPANWRLVHRGVLARLNGGPHNSFLRYDDVADPIKPTVLVLAELAHAAKASREGRR